MDIIRWLIQSRKFWVMIKAINLYQTILTLQSYFDATPQERVTLREKYAKKIKTLEEVLITLSLGNSSKIKESYNGAIALLAECREIVLTQGINFFRKELTLREKVNEENLEILIKAVACASLISPEKKLSLITGLLVNNLGRLTKLTLIDALIILADDLDYNQIKPHLERFLSPKETDAYVRQCAKEALEDIQ